MINKNKYYKSDSFYLGSYLLSENFELAGIENHSDPGKYIFCFYNTAELLDKVKQFYSLSAFVKPQDYANAERTLRSIIYAERNKNKF